MTAKFDESSGVSGPAIVCGRDGCDDTFVRPARSRRLYCSEPCRRRVNGQRRAERRIGDRTLIELDRKRERISRAPISNEDLRAALEATTAAFHELRRDRDELRTALAEVIETRQLLKEVTDPIGPEPRYRSLGGQTVDDLLRMITVAIKRNCGLVKALRDRPSEEDLKAASDAADQGINALGELASIVGTTYPPTQRVASRLVAD